MLGKLLKYDFKAIFKYFLPMSVFLLFYSCLGTMLFSVDENSSLSKHTINNALTLFVIISFFLMVFTYLIVTQGIIVVGFYKSMVTDSAYLTHTLPVSTLNLLLGKLISGSSIILLSYMTSTLSALIMFDIPSNAVRFQREITTTISLLRDELHLQTLPILIFSMIFAILSGLLFTLCTFFMCIAVGQLMHTRKVAGAFFTFIAIKIGIQLLSLLFGKDFVPSGSLLIPVMSKLFIQSSLFMAVYSAIMLFVIHYIFSHKLNLD